MKTATGLTLIALGAVLAFAVNGHPWFLNLQVVGWIIMIIGLVGMVVPRRGYGWLRRQVVLRRGPDGRPVMRTRRRSYPTYTMIDPAAPAAAPYEAAAPYDTAEMPVAAEPVDPAETIVPREPVIPPGAAGPRAAAGPEEEVVGPTEEVVEEYYPE